MYTIKECTDFKQTKQVCKHACADIPCADASLANQLLKHREFLVAADHFMSDFNDIVGFSKNRVNSEMFKEIYGVSLERAEKVIEVRNIFKDMMMNRKSPAIEHKLITIISKGMVMFTPYIPSEETKLVVAKPKNKEKNYASVLVSSEEEFKEAAPKKSKKKAGRFLHPILRSENGRPHLPCSKGKKCPLMDKGCELSHCCVHALDCTNRRCVFLHPGDEGYMYLGCLANFDCNKGSKCPYIHADESVEYYDPEEAMN